MNRKLENNMQDTMAFVAMKDAGSLSPHHECHLQSSERYQR